MPKSRARQLHQRAERRTGEVAVLRGIDRDDDGGTPAQQLVGPEIVEVAAVGQRDPTPVLRELAQ